MIRILIVDDHPVYRDGLRRLLTGHGYEVVGETADGDEALAWLHSHEADVVLLDLHMPRVDGLATLERLRGRNVRAVVLTTYGTADEVLPALKAGAAGYLLKDASRADLVNGIEAALRGEPALAPEAARHVVDDLRKPVVEPEFTPREVRLLELVAAGATNREAAAELFVSEATVKAYLQRIYARLDARDRASAVAEAYRRGIVR